MKVKESELIKRDKSYTPSYSEIRPKAGDFVKVIDKGSTSYGLVGRVD